MENLFISDLNKKDVNHFTSNIGLYLRRKLDKPFKKLCNIFTNANIKKVEQNYNLSDLEYFDNLSLDRVPTEDYSLKKGKNNIVLERYPKLNKDEPYIFICNHTCPEDIETVLNIIDRNAYLVLGSIETLKYNWETYLLWLNGVIPFDILDKKERKELMGKMERVLKTNSILIFPEGSHNYNPNKIVNNLFDGPVNLARKTGRKIVVLTLVKDNDNEVAYIDASNPVDISKVDVDIMPGSSEKEQVKALSSYLRDKMATSVYHIISRHFDTIKRADNPDIEKELREDCIEDAFSKLKWEHDVFDAEYLVKKTDDDKQYEDVVMTLSNLRLNMDTLRQTGLDSREYILKKIDLQEKDVSDCMREHWKIKRKEKVKKLS